MVQVDGALQWLLGREVTRKTQGSRGEWHPGTQSKECGKKLVGVGHLEGESEG